jgi:cystinosin
LNRKRKSTTGWSIGNILLDFTGGTLSIVQLVLDAVRLGDIRGGIGGIIVKL